MKAVFIGGGAHRLLPILRGALAEPGIFEGGEINLYDPNTHRARVMGELLQKTPEYRLPRPKITWGTSLDEALDGASAVGVVLMAGSPLRFALSNAACLRHGFIGSDNVSPSGAFLGVKTAPILLNIARRMERLCPGAWLIDFANPVAVMSSLVNRHTRIKALGVCQGFANHQWDLSRIFGHDQRRRDIEVEAAGINHLSFIIRGSIGGKELFGELDRVIGGPWKMPALLPSRSEAWKGIITRSVTNLVRFYRELGVMIFSTEPDGMAHLYHDEYIEQNAALGKKTAGEIEVEIATKGAARAEANRSFESHLDRDLNNDFWQAEDLDSSFARETDDIFIRVLKGISGAARVPLVSSHPNRGAIEGISDEVVVEYSQFLFKDRLEPAGRYRVPPVVQGLVNSLAVHQTMLADACAAGDPQLLAQALLAYPVHAYTRRARALYRELIELNREEISPAFHTTIDYLK